MLECDLKMPQEKDDARDQAGDDTRVDEVLLQIPPPLVPTPMSPTGLQEDSAPQLPSDFGEGIRSHAPDASPQQEHSSSMANLAAGGGRGRPKGGALQHFRGRNVLCLGGRCVLGELRHTGCAVQS